MKMKTAQSVLRVAILSILEAGLLSGGCKSVDAPPEQPSQEKTHPGPDEVKFRGTALRGTLINLTSEGVEFDLGYGKNTIPLSDVEALKTGEVVYIVHGDRERTAGKILAIEGGELLVEDESETTRRIPIATVKEVESRAEAESFMGGLRDRYRFWKVSLNAGLQTSFDTSDEIDLTVGFEAERRKKPTRFVAKLDYTFGEDTPKGDPVNKTDNEIVGRLKGEYDLTERFFAFGATYAEYDEIDRISIRWLGAAGPGYRLIHTEKYRFQVEVGGGYTYVRFFGGESNEFATIPFSAEGHAKLSHGVIFATTASYLPSLKHWKTDYLILTDASLIFPVSRHLALRATLRNTYDNTPDPGAEKNELRTLLSLSWNF